MSKESAEAFVSNMYADEDYAQSVVEARSKEERRELLNKRGYEFSLEELEAAISEFGLSDDERELTSNELTAVAGGARRRASGGRFFTAAIKSFKTGFTSGRGIKCDGSGSEDECVC
ncbi:Nitrogen fixation protein of unknown function [Prochlorococcus marinus str. MIT 1313]|uniref:Nif11-like leader peptide family RiPP precursor n=1 Tax=Prochlorococcus TaxID=1218 RepID=UPI0007B3523E|nr:Nif11-like leader peptide family RiPP precursor [Prochlorococcus marinus]KZR70016.1 Nitrogen fixation protein of unknown function [Prochlorococcus marinus str. MIT 1313]KZR72740.1 Nitrogen fixation protein of unknown function [Prochlorococcus marinus str. MIT 1318]